MTFINGRRVLQMAWVVPVLLLMNPTYADVVVIAHPSNPTASLTMTEVKRIYLGKMKRWTNGNAMGAIDQQAPSSARDEFYEQVVGKTQSQISAYWSQLIFSGKGSPPPEKSDDESVKEWVAGHPDSIGYVSSSSVDGTVKVLLSITTVASTN